MSGEKVAVVSGCSGGIGAAIAGMLAEKGYTVCGLSRHAGNDPRIRYFCADVTDETAVAKVFKEIDEEFGRVDILVNNAGSGISGAVEFTESEQAHYQLDVNFYGGFHCTKAAAPIMRRCGGGRIVNMSSVAAIFSVPFQAFYSASKAAVNSLTMALRSELKQFGISVCAVMPGDVKTGFTAARKKLHEGDDVYGGAISRSVAVMEKDETSGMQPEKVAAVVVKAACAKKVKPFYIAGGKYKLFGFLGRILPSSLVSYIVSLMYVK